MLTELKDQKSFEAAVGDSNLTVVHFQADWAEQCTQVKELLETLSTQDDYSNTIKFYSCPAEDVSEVSLKYNVEAVPTVILFRSGKRLDTVQGADASKITEIIKKHSTATGDSRNSLEDRLKSLINKASIMLFMKGNRNQPKCGFSRQMIDILNNTGASYETFDILTDEEVRQGLKTYSDWPTYPQLYIKGELIGGLDIVKEMLAAGELEPALKG